MLSVCIATYNGSVFIKEQLLSILGQIDVFDEIIISDDCSTDDTLQIAASLNDPRIKIFTHIPFKHPAYNFEYALMQATGDILFLADQDDIWTPNKVEITLKYLEGSDFVFSDAFVTNENLIITRSSFYKGKTPSLKTLNNLINNSYFGATIAFKRKILEKALPFPKNIPMHDQWLGLIAHYYFRDIFIPETLIYYRRHNNNASFCSEKSENSFQKRISFRICITFEFIKRIIKIWLQK
jgi:glycosyltransferase involved in cell wall biosynthesis